MQQDIRNTLLWMACATAVLILAIWQAQVAVKADHLAREVSLPPPLKIRHAERTQVQTETGNPIANYQSRQEMGLSDREIRWIIDDFRTVGLDQGIRTETREEYLNQRQAQDRWYRDTLIEGWSLDAAQAAEVTSKLANLFDRAKADFIETLNAGPRPFQVDGKWFNLTGTEPIYQLVEFSRRIASPESPTLPWRLCKLPVEDLPKIEFPQPTPLAQSRSLLPLTKANATEGPIDSLDTIRKMHPAQLKLLLLISPAITQSVVKLLKTPSS